MRVLCARVGELTDFRRRVTTPVGGYASDDEQRFLKSPRQNFKFKCANKRPANGAANELLELCACLNEVGVVFIVKKNNKKFGQNQVRRFPESCLSVRCSI